MVEIAVDGSKRRLGEIRIGVNERETSQTSKNGEERREEKKGTTHMANRTRTLVVLGRFLC